MLAANIAPETSESIIARAAQKSDAPFFCPECGAEVILRQGNRRIPHFAHKPPVTCEYGSGETEAHRQCKIAIFDELRAAGVRCELEKSLPGARPDIFFFWNQEVPCAIEVQRSDLSVEILALRTQRYHELGVFVLWLRLFDNRLGEAMYAPRPWEMWLHAAYFGRIYCWKDSLRIQPVSLASITRQEDYRTWYAPGDGEARLSGGQRTLKRYRKPILYQECHLLTDFRPRLLSAWEGKNLSLPPRRLFLVQTTLPTIHPV